MMPQYESAQAVFDELLADWIAQACRLQPSADEVFRDEAQWRGRFGNAIARERNRASATIRACRDHLERIEREKGSDCSEPDSIAKLDSD